MFFKAHKTVWDWLNHPAIQAVLSIAILLVAVQIGFRVLSRLRASTIKGDTSVDDLAQNFQEMRLEGDIDDKELRKIMAVLGKSQETHTGN